MLERLKGTGVVGGAHHGEGLPRGVKRVQVEQHVVRVQQGAQDVGDLVLVIGRFGADAQIAVEVAIPLPGALLIGAGVRHRHHREDAPFYAKGSSRQLVHDLRNGLGTASLIAMDRTKNHDLRPRLQCHELVNMKK